MLGLSTGSRKVAVAGSLALTLFAGSAITAARAATEQVVYDLGRGSDPQAGLINVGGIFYGTTGSKVFLLRPPMLAGSAWTERVLHSFKGSSDGIEPNARLLDVGRTLYGTTLFGGTNNNGTVFSVGRHGGAEAVIYAFSGGSDGAYPQGPLINIGNALYGTTTAGGGKCHDDAAGGCGTVFKITPPAVAGEAWTKSVLFDFKGGRNGGFPHAGLINVGRRLYGTTAAGGTTSSACPVGCGTVFELIPPAAAGGAWTQAVIHSFTGSDGSRPDAVLINVGGTLYGTTSEGGGTDCQHGSDSGCGTVFELVPPAAAGGAWTEAVLHAFAGGNDGSSPYAELINVGGALYGTTNTGGDIGSSYLGIAW